MFDEGYIKLHRKILRSALWTLDGNHICVAITCLLMANWKDAKWYDKYAKKETLVLRGTVITSIKKIAEEAEVSKQVVRTALEHLKGMKFLTCRATSKYTTVAICNYDTYQDGVEVPSEESNTQSSTQPNKRTTNEQQTDNKRITTIEEDKELEKVKEIKELIDQSDLGLIFNSCKDKAPRMTGKDKKELLRLVCEEFLKGLTLKEMLDSIKDVDKRKAYSPNYFRSIFSEALGNKKDRSYEGKDVKDMTEEEFEAWKISMLG